MRGWIAAGLMMMAVSGCAPQQGWLGGNPTGPYQSLPPVCYDNPMRLPISDHTATWETVVDVVDDYFRIKREDPVRLIGDTLTSGQLETYPKSAATLFEPWHNDSVGLDAQIEATLQPMRRWAMVRVEPVAGGHSVEVIVFKELEDVAQPEHATAGSATFRYDETLTRVVNPVGGREVNQGWIPQGRDPALEQQILADLLARCSRWARF